MLIFADDIELLKQAYFAVLKTDRHPDYDGFGFNIILDMDKNFAHEYIEWMFTTQERYKGLGISNSEDQRSYDFLWKRDDYKEVVAAIIQQIQELELSRDFVVNSYLEVFFIGEKSNDESIRNRKEELLSELLSLHHQNEQFVRFIFHIVANLAYEKRKHFLSIFLHYNKDFDLFTRLRLEPSSWGWSGSLVPVLQEKCDFYESLLPLFSSIELLQHRCHVEEVIRHIREDIKREKKRDFIGR